MVITPAMLLVSRVDQTRSPVDRLTGDEHRRTIDSNNEQVTSYCRSHSCRRTNHIQSETRRPKARQSLQVFLPNKRAIGRSDRIQVAIPARKIKDAIEYGWRCAYVISGVKFPLQAQPGSGCGVDLGLFVRESFVVQISAVVQPILFIVVSCAMLLN